MIWFARRDRDSGEQTSWIKQVLPRRYVCVGYQLNSDQHSDYFVWKDTSERVTRRCDDTVDKKRVKFCVLNLLNTPFGGSWVTKKIAKNPWKCSLQRATYVCCFVLWNWHWGIVTVPGFSRVNRLHIITWGGRILTIHLNHVAGYTDPLLFLFKRTQQLMPLTTRGKPWRLRVWAGPKFRRVIRSHRWGPWVMKRFLGYWSPQELRNLPPSTTENQSNTCFF